MQKPYQTKKGRMFRAPRKQTKQEAFRDHTPDGSQDRNDSPPSLSPSLLLGPRLESPPFPEKSSQASSTMAPSHTSFDFLQSTDCDRQSLVCLASVFLPQKIGAPGTGASAVYFSPFPLNQGRSWPRTRKEYLLE